MIPRLRRIVRDLGRSPGHSLVQILLRHLDADLESATLAAALVAGEISADRARETMTRIEHRGDSLRAELAAGLSRALVTPIDREDMYRLSRSIDDILDNLRDFVREWSLYAPSTSRALREVLAEIAQAIGELRSAVAVIGDPGADLVGRLLAAKKACNGIRRRYQIELGQLFSEELSMDVLKRRELLRRLDVAGLRLGEAVDVLSDAAVKRGA
jgi:uncharacterized protein Yka (UPF0111/DUF47 family)